MRIYNICIRYRLSYLYQWLLCMLFLAACLYNSLGMTLLLGGLVCISHIPIWRLALS